MVGAYYYEYNSTQIPTQPVADIMFQNSTVYYSDGSTAIGTFGTIHRQILAYNQIPKVVQDAVVAAEDRGFWTEGGISPTGILRAAYDDLTSSGGNLSGGSTITQQFVRNYYQDIGTAQTASRKIKEIFVAMKLAKEKSKPWILTNYLNTIYLGTGAYGVAAAAADLLPQAGSQAHRRPGGGHRGHHPAADQLPAAAVPAGARGPLALRAERHGDDGGPDPAAG